MTARAEENFRRASFSTAIGFGKRSMKIDWKKILFKQIGPDRRRKVSLPPPESFNRMAQYTFTAAGFLIAAAALPGIFLVIAGENVYLRGFGSFIIKEQAQKTARDITRNKTIVVPARRIAAFRPSKELSERVR